LEDFVERSDGQQDVVQRSEDQGIDDKQNVKLKEFLKVLKAILKSIGWNTVAIIAGLLQLLVLLLLALINNKTFSFEKILMDGVILFFCSAFVITSVIDYYSISRRYPKSFEAIFFFIIPLFMIVFIITLYCAIVEFGDGVDIEVLKVGTMSCSLVAVTHSLIFRTLKIYFGSSE